MRDRRKLHRLIPAVALAVAAAEASAQVFYEPFDYGNNAAGNANLTNNLVDGGNSVGFGRTNQTQGVFWTRTGSGTTDHTVQADSLSLTGGMLPDSAGSKVGFNSTGTPDRIGMGQILTSGRVYFSLLLRFDTLPTTASSRISGFNTFSLDQPGNATVFGTAITTRAINATEYQVGVAKNSATAIFPAAAPETTFEVGETVLVVGAYEIVGGVGSDDVGYMWLNPTAADFGADFAGAVGPTTGRLTDTNGADLHDAVGGGASPLRNPSIASFLLRANGANSPWRIDELRVDTTWAGVTPRKDLQYAWNAAGGGAFADASKWNSNAGAASPTPNSLGAVANFGAAITAPATITTAGETIDTINIDNTNSLTIGGAGLTVSTNASAGQIIARRGSHTISAPLTLVDDLAIKVAADANGTNGATLTLSGNVTGAGRTISKYGLGTLKLGGSNIVDDSATLAVRAGTLDLNGNNETVGTVIVGTGHRNTGIDLNTTAQAATGAITGAGTLSATTVQLENGSISAALGGTTAVLKTTQGVGRLSGASSYTGDTTIRAGTLLVGADAPTGANGALGNSTNAIIVSDAQTISGTIDPGAAPKAGDPVSLLTDAAVTIARDVLVNPQGYPTLGGNSAHSSTFSGGITLNRATNLTAAAGGTVRFSGSIVDGAAAGSVTKLGAGDVILAGANSYSGNTAVNAGALVADNPAALPGWDVSGRVTANAGGYVAGSAGGAGQFTSAQLDTLLATTTYAAGGGFGINVDTGNSFTYATNITPAIAFGKFGGGTLVLSGTNNQISTLVGGGALEVASEANLGPAPAAPANNITLRHGGTLRFAASFDPSNNRTIVLGGGEGVIDTDSHTVNIGATINGGGTLVKTGGGLLNLGGSNGYTGGTVIRGGTLSVFNDANLGNFAGGLTFDGGALRVFSSFTMTSRPITVTAGGGTFLTNGFDVEAGTVTGAAGTLVKDNAGLLTVTHVRAGGLSINGGSVKVRAQANPHDVSSFAGVNRIDSFTIGSASRLDLTNTKLITNKPLGTFDGTAYSGIQGDLARAYNFGAWDQPGLTTSEDLADPTSGPLGGTATLAVNKASEVLFIGETDTALFAGQTVTGASTIAMYTYAGDVNLDGLVDAADYGVIDNWIQFPGTDGYMNGDFNYDGVIDAADYGIIDNSIQLQGAPFVGVGSGASAGLAGVTAVPEPAAAACGLAAVVGVGLFTRRRRNA